MTDPLGTAVHGARETVLIDVGPIASVDWDVCRRTLPRSRMHPWFQRFRDDELCIGTINATLYPR